ncbi:MAG TPA: tetratricopeptide repeat protein [Gemmatimonadaceae bacterium]|nr:tetratricopeptide repeat protein [Gemmatimonadaceae bacterium]
MWAALALAIATFVIYAPAWKAPFQFDDIKSIEENQSISRLWPPSFPLHPTPMTATSGRPVVNYTLALNFAFDKLIGIGSEGGPGSAYAVVSFRVLNVLLHLACGALLFGVLRRTLRRQEYDAEWAAHADGVALLVTTIWLVHPIQSEAVNYVVQRTELIVSGCYLGTLYASIRAWDAATARGRVKWYVVGGIVCLLGMGSKEVMISAPLAVMLYDRAFRLSSWKQVVRPGAGRGWFYLGLAATAGWLVDLMAGNPRASTVGFGGGMTWYQYLYSQCWAILHYVRLFFWPDQLTLDYGKFPVHGLAGVPGLIVLTACGVATIVAWTRPQRWGWFGFLGAWFFMILAPSSSVVPITTEIAAERRIYLPLVSVIIVLVASLDALRRRMAGTAPAGRRSRDEVSPKGSRETAWRLVFPAVGLFYLAIAGWKAHQLAIGAAASSTEISPSVVAWVVRLGVSACAVGVTWLVVRGRHPRWAVAGVIAALAITTFGRSETYASPISIWSDAVRKVPDNPRAYYPLGTQLLMMTPPREAEASALFHEAIALDSNDADGWDGLAQMAIVQHRDSDAKVLLARELSIRPTDDKALLDLGNLLVEMKEPAEALAAFERAAAVDSDAKVLILLGHAYAAVGRTDDATRTLLRVVAEDSSRTDVLSDVGAILVRGARPADAIPYLERSARANPSSALNLARLSLAYAGVGRGRDAVITAAHAAPKAGDDPAVYRTVGHALLLADSAALASWFLNRSLQLAPDDAEATTLLGDAKLALGSRDAAIQLYRHAIALDPAYAPAKDALARASHGR